MSDTTPETPAPEVRAREKGAVACCTFDGCANPINGRGLCGTHARQMKVRGRMSPVPSHAMPARFWAKVNKDGPVVRADLGQCWEWTGSRSTGGYGRMYASPGRYIQAHRASWELANGPIPVGLLACHHCDNRGCVRPSHLFLGTAVDNAVDMVNKDRHVRGFKLSDDDVLTIRRRHRGGAPSRQLAREFGVSVSNARNVINRTQFRRLP